MNDYQNGTYGLTPIGTIIQFMGTKAPNGYLFCDGTVYNITDYPEFCDFLLDQFGSVNKFGGDGTTTFAVPDLRGEFLRCTGTNGHTNSGNGANVGSHQTPTLMSNHWIYTNGNKVGMQFYPSSQNYTGVTNFDNIVSANLPLGKYFEINKTDYTWSQPVSLYSGIRPTNTSVYMCIRVK